MARPLRDFRTARWFHIGNRGADRQDIVGTDSDRHDFITLVAEACDTARLRIDAYALMSNHFHALIDVDSCDDPSAAIGWFQNQHSKRFNRRTDRTGPLFERRFWSRPVTDEAQYLCTARYIHRNPLAIVSPKQLPDYPWSSLPAYLERVGCPPWLSTARLAGLIEPQPHLAQLITPPADDLALIAFGPASGALRASIEQIAAAVEVAGPPSPGFARRLRAELGLRSRADDVVDIAAFEGVSPSQIRRRASAHRRLAARQPEVRTFERRVLRILTQPATLGLAA